MKSVHDRWNTWQIILAASFALLYAGAASALDLTSLKGQGVDAAYGRYAPHGDCSRGPYVTVGDAGFAFEVAGKALKTTTFVNVLTYAGPDYQGISRWFFPFVVNDTHPILLTLNADEKKGALTIEAYDQGYKGGPPLTPLNAALVKGSPYARCGQPAAATATSAMPDGNAAKSVPPISAATLDWAALPALVGKHQGDFDLFGAGSAAGALKSLLGSKRAVLRDNLQVGSPLRREGDVYYLSGNAPHQGGEDQAYVLFDGTRRAVQVGLWEKGRLKTYRTPGQSIAPPSEIRKMIARSPPEDAVATPGVRWQLRPVSGRPPLALALAAGSPEIKSLSVFCNGGRPLLAMLLHRAPAPGPVKLDWVFRGGLVGVPMARGNNVSTLWLGDLGGSPLPRMLAAQGGVAYLRINGRMNGQVSMDGAATATRSALGGCYRY